MSRRTQIIMTEDEVAAYLRDRRTIIITSIGRDGMPHPVPMWFALEDDGALVMSTFTKSQKIRNLKRDPRVALLAEDGEVYAELSGVLITGEAELLPDTDDVIAVLSAIGRQVGEASATALSETEQAGLRAQATKRTAIRIRPQTTVSWNHRKLGGVY